MPILDETQGKHVKKLIDEITAGKQDKSALREYLVSQRSSLMKKEILPEYLYYFLCYQFKLL